MTSKQNDLDTNLLIAARDGDALTVRDSLRQGANANYRDSMPLRQAAGNGHLEAVSVLLEHGANINALNGAPLLRAVEWEHAQVALYLLEKGADVRLDHGAAFVEAVENDMIDVVKEMAKRGADVHAYDDIALVTAVSKGQTGMVDILLKFGADPFAQGMVALGSAHALKEKQIIDLLVNTIARQVAQFHLDLLKAEDIDKFAKEPYSSTGESGLMRAVKMSCVEQLAEKGLNITPADLTEAKDRAGKTALARAAELGDVRPLFTVKIWGERYAQALAVFEKIPQEWFDQGIADRDMLQPIAVAADLKKLAARMPGNRFKL